MTQATHLSSQPGEVVLHFFLQCHSFHTLRCCFVLQPGEAVLHHGDVSHALYFIRTGQAAVYKPRNNRNSTSVNLPIPGENELRSTSDGDSSAGIKLIEEDMERVAVLNRGAAFGEGHMG